MSWIHVEASSVIDARPEDVYAIVSDYRVGHPAILPKQHFTELIVEKGGQGAGTVVRVSARVWGKEYPFHQQVTEPEPGKVLVETDVETGQWTRFTFEPLDEGKQTRVTITSEFPPSRGITGLLQRFMLPPVVRDMYRKELQNLTEYVRSANAALRVS